MIVIHLEFMKRLQTVWNCQKHKQRLSFITKYRKTNLRILRYREEHAHFSRRKSAKTVRVDKLISVAGLVFQPSSEMASRGEAEEPATRGGQRRQPHPHQFQLPKRHVPIHTPTDRHNARLIQVRIKRWRWATFPGKNLRFSEHSYCKIEVRFPNIFL